MNPIKILILTANPKIPNYEPLRLDAEVREIEEALRRSQHRDRFQLETQLATRTKDLRRALLDHQPQIVHFSGHGSGEQGLVLENDAGTLQLVSTEALTQLFTTSEISEVECVLLNACYSEVQAIAIHQIVDCVIGMHQQIGDKAAIHFAEGFYDALGAGRPYEEAYKIGCTAIALEGIPEHQIPVLKHRKRGSAGLPVEPSASPAAVPPERVTGAIADPPARSSQSQSFGNITISGSNNPFSNIQSAGNVSFSQTSLHSGSTDLEAALEALVKLKQEVSAADALSTFVKKDTESKIDMLQEELQKPKPDRSFVDEVVEALKKGLAGVVTLATPVTEVAKLVANAYVG
jgi:CHAT domain